MASLDSTILFDDIFTISEVAKSFDRVARITARSENHEMDLTLDINSDLYPLQVADQISMALASSLIPEDVTSKNNDPSGNPMTGGANSVRDAWRPGKGGLADEYQYVMYGKVYKFDEGTEDRVSAYASFGGLLMALSGSYRHVNSITVGQNIYILLRKT